MKKLIATFIILVPAIMIAQPVEQEQPTDNPFHTLVIEEKVNAEYIDINQTAALLDLTNSKRSTRGKARGNNAQTSISRNTVDVNQLTEGLNLTDQSTLNSFLEPSANEEYQK